MSNRLSVDVGGTFTDLVFVDEKGLSTITKVLSTPDDTLKGVIKAIEETAIGFDSTINQLLEDCSLFIHGSTITTNALIQNKTAKTGLLCTNGHRHILYYRDAGKTEPYNLKMKYPKPLVPLYLTLPIEERINSEGDIEVPLNEDGVREAIRQFKNWNIEAIAVCLLFSVINPKHEIRIGEIIKEEWPEIAYSISSEVQPLIREYQRTCAVAMDASLKPIMTQYVANLQQSLTNHGFDKDIFLVVSSGGVMTGSDAAKRPIYTVNSGPVIGPVAGKNCGDMVGTDNIIIIDMGGTSFDVSTVVDGMYSVSREQKIGNDPLGVIIVEVTTIGAGGGSIASIDSGGMLCVGPNSAGANPGPACYDMGGMNPTVTDADLLLGYLNPDNFLGGKMKLNKKLSQNAINEIIARPLKINDYDAAISIIRVVEEKMLNGIEELTVKRGIDPREFLLVAGGGGGPMHAASIAEGLGITQVMVPKYATAFCAYGMQNTDLKYDNAMTFYTDSLNFDASGVNSILEQLENKGRQILLNEGIDPKDIRVECFAEARYPFQVWGIEFPLQNNRINKEVLESALEDFENLHESRYGSREPGQHIEFTHWRVSVSGIIPKVSVPEQKLMAEDASQAVTGERNVYFDTGEVTNTKIYDGNLLNYGNLIEGPAIIEEPGTTVVIPANWVVSINSTGDYLMKTV